METGETERGAVELADTKSLAPQEHLLRKADKAAQTFPEIEAIMADSAYKAPHIRKKVFGDGRALSAARKRPMTGKGGHEWWRYAYDER